MNTRAKIVSFLCICCSLIIINQQQYPDMHYAPQECPADNNQLPTAPSTKCNPIIEPADLHIATEEKHDTHFSRTIKVNNKITQKMIAYSKGFMQYTPDFTLTINNVPIKQGNQQQIVIENNCITVGYTYNFVNGYKKGSKEIEFMVPVTEDELDITFSWQDDWRVVISGAQPHKVISEIS